jgi:hypothetical protein
MKNLREEIQDYLAKNLTIEGEWVGSADGIMEIINVRAQGLKAEVAGIVERAMPDGPIQGSEERRPDLGVCTSCHVILAPDQIERMGEDWGHVVAVDGGRGEPEPAPCGPVEVYYRQPAAPAPEQSEAKRCGTCPHDEPCNKCPVYLREYKPEPAQAAPSEEELEESAEIAARQLTANMQMEINEAMARGPGASDSEIREIMHGNIKRFILANVAALRSRLAGQGDRL